VNFFTHAFYRSPARRIPRVTRRFACLEGPDTKETLRTDVAVENWEPTTYLRNGGTSMSSSEISSVER
jgi:hypothetical protein